ncbi:hypothetical protein [Sulfolobus sp. S-194]|nr:hypothetical protein [Sulfolobus sp. S-194]
MPSFISSKLYSSASINQGYIRFLTSTVGAIRNPTYFMKKSK